MSYVLCDVCHRVLRTEDGPVCPECQAKEGTNKPKDKSRRDSE